MGEECRKEQREKWAPGVFYDFHKFSRLLHHSTFFVLWKCFA